MRALTDIDSRLRSLIEAASHMATLRSLASAGRAALEEFARISRARGGSLYVLEGDQLSLCCALDPGHAAQTVPLPPPEGSALARLERDRRPVLIGSLAESSLTPSGYAGYACDGALLLPLIAGDGALIGACCLHDREDAKFESQDLELATIFASICGIVMSGLRARETFEETESGFREIFAHSATGIVVYDIMPDRRFKVLMYNDAVADLVGIAGSEAVGKYLEEVVPPKTAEFLSYNYERTIETGRPESMMLGWVELPGGRRAVQTTIIPLRNANGDVTRVAALPMDVTDHMLTEEAFAQSEITYREIIENTSEGIFMLDVMPDNRFRVLMYNPAMERMVGMTNAEVTGKYHAEFLSPELADKVDENNLRCLEAGSPIGFYEDLDLPGGHYLWHTTLVPVRNKSGRIYRIVGVARDITDAMRMQRALRSSEEKFSKAFYLSPDAISIARLEDGVILEANEGFKEINGYSREEAIGRSTLPFDMGLWPSAELRRKYVELLKANGEVHGFEMTFRRRDGSERYVSLSAKLIEMDGEPCIITTSHDLTERRRLDRALEESQARYREIFENTSDGLFVISVTDPTTYRLLSMNPAQARMLGLHPEEAVGKINEDFLPPDFAARVRNNNVDCIAGGEPTTYEDYLDGPGGRRFLSTTLVPIKDLSGKVVRLIGVSRDITERKHAEEREREHEQQLLQVAKLSSLGTLVSGIAHEINNPNNYLRLNSQNLKELWEDIRAFVDRHAEEEDDLMLHGIPYAQARGMIDELFSGIEEGTKRIENLVQNLRNYARGDEGDLSDNVNVAAVLGSAIMIVHSIIKERTDHFIVNETPDLPRIKGNYHQIEQVIINLITNACQSLPSRDRRVTVTTSYDSAGGWVLVEVADEGTGIPAQVLHRVTDPFFTTKQASGGSGLGLAVSSRIVSNHGGTLSFHSELGAGTHVTVRLPVPKENA